MRARPATSRSTPPSVAPRMIHFLAQELVSMEKVMYNEDPVDCCVAVTLRHDVDLGSAMLTIGKEVEQFDDCEMSMSDALFELGFVEVPPVVPCCWSCSSS